MRPLQRTPASTIITFMISAFPPLARLVPLLVLTALMTACGYAEWPPRSDVRRDVEGDRQPSSDATAFRAATAVTVGKGDSVYALSRRHRVSMRAIIEANNLRPPFHLRVGQRIVLPRQPEHLVEKGDTLSQIAHQRNIGMYDLARVNALRPPYTIYVGQRLRLPRGAVTSGASSVSVTSASETKTVSVSPDAGKQPTKAKALPPLSRKTPDWAKKQPAMKRPVRTAVRPRRVAAGPVSKPPPRAGKGFQWPVRGRVISSFGSKAKGLRNDGINIAAARGTPVKAADNGVVVYAGNELRAFGNLLLIRHAGGWVSAYAHNEVLLVKRGDKVRKGQKIGAVGSSGSVVTPQLHFELRKNRRARNPGKYLSRV